MARALAPINSTPYCFEHAVLGKFHRDVERGLAAHRGQERVGPLARDDELDEFGRHGLDVGPVGELGIRHDRRRIGVHEHDLVALLLERLDGLRPGVVELGALADYDRARAEQEDAAEVSTTRHVSNRAARSRRVTRECHTCAVGRAAQ